VCACKKICIAKTNLEAYSELDLNLSCIYPCLEALMQGTYTWSSNWCSIHTYVLRSLPDWHDLTWAFVYQINVHVYVYKGCIHVHSSWNKWRYSGCDILPQEEETIQKEVDSATECTLDLRMHRFGCTRQRRGTNLLSVVEILQTYASNRSGASLSKESSVHAGASSILPSQAGPSQLDASSEHDASVVTTVAWGCPPMKRKTREIGSVLPR
jgi:hypothetical protein